MEEIWKDIEEFKGLYQVSNLGRVRSVERFINTRTYPSVIMSQYTHHNGKQISGMRVHLRNPKKEGQIQRSVAKLVLLTFKGLPPKNAKQVKHIDGNPLNNNLDNLMWDVDKSFYMAENSNARQLFNEQGYELIQKYFKVKQRNHLYLDSIDTEDLIQECAIAIWNVIDVYDEKHCSFERFVFMKCDWIFNKSYKKYARRKELVGIIKTESLPIEKIKELSYVEYYDE